MGARSHALGLVGPMSAAASRLVVLGSAAACGLVVLVSVAGCGGGRRAADAGPEADGGGRADAGPRDGGGTTDGATDDAGEGADAAGGDSGSGTDAGRPLPLCRIGCAMTSDCASPSPAFDADNYDCRAGVCEYTGCNDDPECASTFASSDFVCRDTGGLRTCIERCAVAADCGSGTAAFDADNYVCEGDVCRYTGCNSDAECASTFMSARYVCRDVMPPDVGIPIPTAARNCVLGCATPADCTTASPAFDADNYDCVEGGCVYRGCNDDEECRASFMMPGYICR